VKLRHINRSGPETVYNN